MLERDREATARGAGRPHGKTYNELILDGWQSNSHLPHSIEAFVESPGDNSTSIRRTHEAFMAAYRLDATQVPLLRFHPERDRESWRPVFEQI